MAAVYRPGSVTVTASFFSELSDVLDCISTFAEPVLLVGDVNIWLDRPTDADAVQFTELLAAHGLANHVTLPTHELGGMLDVVVSRVDQPPLLVDEHDVGLSDHRLLQWSAQLIRPAPVYTTTTSRPWARLEADAFRAALLASPLCQPDTWSALDVDDLAQLYDDTITAVLDDILPLRTVRCRRRPSDPWFDAECRHAKRRVRRFERAARSATPADAAAAHALWIAERRIYRDLRRQKRESFWTEKVRSEKSCPHELWRSVNDLMGRGSTPASSTGDFHRFMDDKVAGVRASTDRAPPPQYTTAPTDCSLHHFTQLTTDDVVAAVRQLPDKQSATDPIPTRL